MLAAAPTVPNRIASHFVPTPNPLPATPDGKAAAWSDAVFAAMMFYQSQLAHPDVRVAERAAKAIFDLEKTRLRHGRELAGTPAEETVDTSRSRCDARREMPSKADVQRLGRIAELAMEADAIEYHEDAFDEEEDVRERIEAFARSEEFLPLLRGAREYLNAQGRSASDAEVKAFAKRQLSEQLLGRADPAERGAIR